MKTIVGDFDLKTSNSKMYMIFFDYPWSTKGYKVVLPMDESKSIRR